MGRIRYYTVILASVITLIVVSQPANSSLVPDFLIAQKTVVQPSESPSSRGTGEESSSSESGWYMAGANPQRTSWVLEGVDPKANDQFGVEWFRPIEAYIGQHIQLVAARDKLFVSTARGVYALNAASGNLVWRFDTELPIGHSPTVVGNVLYTGSMDGRVYALDADSGSLLWAFNEAKGGFSTNPLVVDGKVMLGSRDGYFYCLNQVSGELIWQYPPAKDDPLGPIFYSAAYKEGQVFFASNDNYAYSLNTSNGFLNWRSSKMPGDGYQAWWPVIIDNLVIFSSAIAYADMADPGTRSIPQVVDPGDPYYAQMHNFQYGLDFVNTLQRDDVFHQYEPDGSKLGPEFISGSPEDTTGIEWSWSNGKQVIEATKATAYLEDDGLDVINRPVNKPWRRGVVVLNIADGTEYTFDSDKNGSEEFAPFVFTGTKSGNRYPPIVIPTENSAGLLNDVMYAQNYYSLQGGWRISRARLMAWQLGTHYIQPVGGNWAIDEPFADSAGGDMLYQNLCCDRVGLATNLRTGSVSQFWGYAGQTLESIKLPWEQIEPWMASRTPGYDVMWSEASMYDYYPRLYGAYGTTNGIYHNHGLQNPIIPYNGRLYVHRSNAIIALGPNPVPIRKVMQNESPEQYEANIREEYPDFSKPLLKVDPPDQDLKPCVSLLDVKVNLDNQIEKMLQTGHLRPGYYNSTRTQYQFANYFENPGDTLLTLVLAYDYVSDWLRPELESYIRQHYKLYFEDTLYSRTGYWIDNAVPYNLADLEGFGQLQPREWMNLPPEVAQDLTSHQASEYPGVNWPWSYPQVNFYPIWLFAEKFESEDPSRLVSAYNLIKTRLDTSMPAQEILEENPWIHNGFIAGYIGFLNLQKLAGMDEQDAILRSAVQSALDELLIMRATQFTKDHPWGSANSGNPNMDKRILSVARNFLYLTPELAEYLRLNALDKVMGAVEEYNWIAPYWLSTRYESSFGELSSDNLYTNHAMFQAKAWILKEPEEQLLKYLDVPAFRVGDLYYIQKLIAILANTSPGFNLYVTPKSNSIETGGDAEYTISIQPTGGFTSTVYLNITYPESELAVVLSEDSATPPANISILITDLHEAGSLSNGLWYSLELTVGNAEVSKVTTIWLLVNGYDSYLPLAVKS